MKSASSFCINSKYMYLNMAHEENTGVDKDVVWWSLNYAGG